jgi:hypothetical protein
LHQQLPNPPIKAVAKAFNRDCCPFAVWAHARGKTAFNATMFARTQSNICECAALILQCEKKKKINYIKQKNKQKKILWNESNAHE